MTNVWDMWVWNGVWNGVWSMSGDWKGLLCPKSPSELWPSFGSSAQPPMVLWPGSVWPIIPHFIIFAYSFISPFLIPFPHTFHVSNICLFHVPRPWSPFWPPIPNSRPISLHIAYLLFYFCFHYCFWPYARFPWLWHVLFGTYMLRTSCMFPQSEIDIDCPFWTLLHLIQTFQTSWISVHPNWGQGNIRWRSIKA